MTQDISLTASDNHTLSAYCNGPEGARKGVVVIQEIFGVNAHIRTVVDRFADKGYRAIAPALFDRIETGVELDYTPETTAKGKGLRSQLDWEGPLADIKASIESLRAEGCRHISVVGFCYGGSLAWLCATRLKDIDIAVGFYGGQVIDFIDESPNCPTMLMFGGLDSMIPQSDIDKIQAKHPSVPIHIFPEADHGFNCDIRSSYHEESALKARAIALEFMGPA